MKPNLFCLQIGVPCSYEDMEYLCHIKGPDLETRVMKKPTHAKMKKVCREWSIKVGKTMDETARNLINAGVIVEQ